MLTHNADGEVVVQRLSEMLPLDEKEQQAIECAYRRGFYQGASAAVEAVDQGHKLAALNAWLNRLYNWRYDRTISRFILPEWLTRKP